MLSNKQYDSLREITQIWLPAMATLYFAISEVWGLPFGPEVVATITALVTFFGVTLKVSRTNYNKSGVDIDGELVVNQTDPEKDLLTLGLGNAIGSIAGKDVAKFRVVNEDGKKGTS